MVKNLPKNPPIGADLRTLTLLGLQGITPISQYKSVRKRESEKEYWQPSPRGFLKFNIDGASKGNPGTTGFGGALRDEAGNILSLFHCYLGRATNNMAKLMAMEQCLDSLKRGNYYNVVIKADSEMVINLVKRINCGSAPEKVSQH